MRSVAPSPFLNRKRLQVSTKDLGPHKYGCLMALLPPSLRKEITDWCLENVLEVHLGPGGREPKPHITIKYGFKDNSTETVARLKRLLTQPIQARLKNMTLFTSGYGKWINEDGDVLKVDIESLGLSKLNAIISESFDCKDSYPEYLPHATVCYLDPAISSFYANAPAPFLNQSITLEEFEWSGADGEREIIRPSLFTSPFINRKALSWINPLSGGALVAPPKRGKVIKLQKSTTSLIDLALSLKPQGAMVAIPDLRRAAGNPSNFDREVLRLGSEGKVDLHSIADQYAFDESELRQLVHDPVRKDQRGQNKIYIGFVVRQKHFGVKSLAWDESKHPRGDNPENPGQFSEVTGNKKPEAPSLKPGTREQSQVSKEPVTERDKEEAQNIAQITEERAKKEYPKLKEQYLKKGGGIYKDGELVSVCLNTDDWRDLFPEYKGVNAGDVHEASSWLNKKLWSEALVEMRGKGNNKVVVLAGGGGSGKGTAVGHFFDQTEYPIRLDQVSDRVEKLEDKLNEAQKNGFDTEYVFVDRAPKDAWNGVVQRALNARKKGGLARTVPLEVALKANIDARKTAIELFRRRTDIQPQVIDNNNGWQNARMITDREEAISHLEKEVYEYPQLFEELKNDTIRLYESGEIPEDIAIGLIGESAITARRPENRSGKGLHRSRPRAGSRARGSVGRIANKAEGHARFGKTAQGNYQIKSGEFREEDHPRGQPSNAGQFSEVTGNKKPERPSLEETRSKLKVGSRSEEIDQPNEWLHEYVFGREGYSPTRTRKPGKKVMEAFSKYVPQKAVVLYRYVKEVKGSGSTGQELRSWTYSKEFAESLLEEFNEGEGKVIKKTFYPNEILVDTTLLPDEYKDDMVDSQQEVVIVYGKLLKEMQEVRGTTPSLTFYPIKGFEESKHPRDESGRFSEVTGNKTPKPPKENFHTVRAAGRFLANKWAKLESRYGRKIALGMAIAMIATSPLPGNIMAIVAAAEAARGISSMMSQKELREILIKSIPTYQDNFTN